MKKVLIVTSSKKSFISSLLSNTNDLRSWLEINFSRYFALLTSCMFT